MPIVTIASTKGGVGKSTITANLAVELLQAGNNVFLFDADPQKTLTKWNGIRDYMREQGENLPQILLGKIPTGGTKAFVAEVQRRQEETKGFILIDTAGTDDEATRSAVLKSDVILTLSSTAPVDLWEIESLLSMVRELEEAQDRKIGFGLLFNRVSTHSHSKAVETAVQYISRSNLSINHIFRSSLRERVIYKNAIGEGRSITEFKPLDSVAALEFNQVVSEFLSFIISK